MRASRPVRPSDPYADDGSLRYVAHRLTRRAWAVHAPQGRDRDANMADGKAHIQKFMVMHPEPPVEVVWKVMQRTDLLDTPRDRPAYAVGGRVRGDGAADLTARWALATLGSDLLLEAHRIAAASDSPMRRRSR